MCPVLASALGEACQELAVTTGIKAAMETGEVGADLWSQMLWWLLSCAAYPQGSHASAALRTFTNQLDTSTLSWCSQG